MFPDVFLALLIDGRIHEEGADRGCRAIDGHGYRGLWIAQVKPGIQPFDIIQRTNTHSGITHLSIDIGTMIGVFPIKGY